jgi:hypothetical protein
MAPCTCVAGQATYYCEWPHALAPGARVKCRRGVLVPWEFDACAPPRVSSSECMRGGNMAPLGSESDVLAACLVQLCTGHWAAPLQGERQPVHCGDAHSCGAVRRLPIDRLPRCCGDGCANPAHIRYVSAHPRRGCCEQACGLDRWRCITCGRGGPCFDYRWWRHYWGISCPRHPTA